MHHSSILEGLRARASGALKGTLLLVTSFGLSSILLSQEAPPPPPPEGEESTTLTATQNQEGGSSAGTQGQQVERRRRSFNPEEMRTRMMAALREEFGVADDAEWALISERINKINELRRSTAMGGFGMRAFGGAVGGPEGRRMSAAFPSNPEMEALQSAIKNGAPDAEIKERLTRLREARKDNEAKLEKAQEDLRAILSVKQEAIAVMMGLLK